MKNTFKNSFKTVIAIVFAVTFYGCEDLEKFQPTEANSIEDATPPSASFTASQGTGTEEAWKEYTFANGSVSATTYFWDFGDGNQSNLVDPVNIYPGEGMYTVTLTASDDLGVTSTFSETIEVIEPEAPMALIPDILESSFEDLSLPDGTGDGRDSWRNSDLGGVIQITSSPTHSGSQASKFPSGGDRIAYQELTITPNTDYTITYYYTLKTNNPGSVTVSVLAGGAHTDLDAALTETIADFEGTDQTSASAYVQATIPFNTGANDTISILVTNQGEEARVDTFSIDAN